MQKFKSRISWALYIICAALIFFYYLFPSDTVKEYMAGQIRRIHPSLTVTIGRVKLAFPPGLMLYEITVYHAGRIIGELENLKIAPNILSLFFDTTHLSFTGTSYGGRVKGGVDITDKSPGREIMVDADLIGIQVDRLEILQTMLSHKISGNLDGTLTLKTNMPREIIAGDLTLTEGRIEFSPPVMNQNVLTFNTIDADVVLDGPSLIINHCVVEGNDLDADIAGSITLAGRGYQKILDLSGTVQPHDALLARLSDRLVDFLSDNNLENREFPFKIKGPMESPQYSFY